MKTCAAFALVLLTGPAFAQDGLEVLQGQFGSATDPAASCAVNPHELSIIDDRPHLARTWGQPVTGSAGSPRLREVYDVEQFDGTAFVLSEEGLYHADPEGAGGLWVMHMTQNPPGYCWRRPDWPAGRCQDQQLRCEKATS